MENLLLTADGTVKLCDFGSATTQCYYPDINWSANQRGMVEEEVSQCYRWALVFFCDKR